MLCPCADQESIKNDQFRGHTRRSHDGSDLDLVLRGLGLKEIPSDQLGNFEEAVRESNIPFLVEARDWARLPERFHREIERDHVVLMEGGGER